MTTQRSGRYPARPAAYSGDTGPWLQALGTVLVAVVVTTLPIMFHLAGQPLGVTLCLILGLIVSIWLPQTAPATLIFAYVFQNLIISFISPFITSMEEFNAIRGYNFILTVAIWLPVAVSYVLNRATFDLEFRKLFDATIVAMALIGFYFAIGMLANPSGALVYLRNIVSPFLLFQVFSMVAYRHRLSLQGPLIILALALVGYGYLELLAHERLFAAINADEFFYWRTKQEVDSGVWLKEMQETGRVIRSYLDTMIVDFLNTPLLGDHGIKVFRLSGPNFHSISFAYALAIFCLVLFAVGHWWYLLLSIPVLLVVGSKGSLIMLMLLLMCAAGMKIFRPRVVLYGLIGLLVAYAVLGIRTGIAAQDYHVIGFLGGIRGFIGQPLGHGLGVGGNLSFNMAAMDWSKSQSLGHTDIAVESAVGVLLYQMGVMAFAIFGIIAWLSLWLWRRYARTGDRMLGLVGLAGLVISVNGIFQEEALFAPLALGLLLAFGGMLVGRECRRSRTERTSKPTMQRTFKAPVLASHRGTVAVID